MIFACRWTTGAATSCIQPFRARTSRVCCSWWASMQTWTREHRTVTTWHPYTWPCSQAPRFSWGTWWVPQALLSIWHRNVVPQNIFHKLREPQITIHHGWSTLMMGLKKSLNGYCNTKINYKKSLPRPEMQLCSTLISIVIHLCDGSCKDLYEIALLGQNTLYPVLRIFRL